MIETGRFYDLCCSAATYYQSLFVVGCKAQIEWVEFFAVKTN